MQACELTWPLYYEYSFEETMFWRIYFFIFTAIIVWGLLTLPYGSISLIVYLSELSEVLQAIALFGFVYELKILTPLFWKITFFCTILVDLIYASAIYAEYAPVILIAMLFNAPALFALFLYAFIHLPNQVKK